MAERYCWQKKTDGNSEAGDAQNRQSDHLATLRGLSTMQIRKYILFVFLSRCLCLFSLSFLVRSCECELCGNSIVQIASFMTLAPLRHFEVEDFGISGSASQLLMTIFPCLLDLPDDQFLWMPVRLLYHIAEKMNIFRISGQLQIRRWMARKHKILWGCHWDC